MSHSYFTFLKIFLIKDKNSLGIILFSNSFLILWHNSNLFLEVISLNILFNLYSVCFLTSLKLKLSIILIIFSIIKMSLL